LTPNPPLFGLDTSAQWVYNQGVKNPRAGAAGGRERERGTMTTKIPVYWSETLKRWVTIPED